MKKFGMKHLLLLLFSGSLLWNCQYKPNKKGQNELKQRPNIILVMTDDQGYGDLGHTGNKIIKTPSIDSFSNQSVNLTNYHVGTTCAPTRAGLLTGRNANRNGVWHTIMGASILNRDEVTIADIFQQNGYKTGMFGKWHLGDNHPFLPHDRGFQEAFYHGGGGIGQTPDYWKNDYFDDTYFRNGTPEKMAGYCTDIWFDEAIKFIEDKKEEPFFCYISLNAPHSPFNVPEEYYSLYKDEPDLLESQKRFYGMITNIDDNFSKLLKKLKSLNIDKNTIVVFTTDNGTSNGYKIDDETKKVYGFNAGMRGTKSSHYDGGHRVPFIIRWPEGGLTGGKKLSELTAHVDMLPTLTSLANIDFSSTKPMDGTDISDFLIKKEKIKDRILVTDTQRVPWPIKGKQSSVMKGNWRLINGNELYDIGIDPGQQNNIADQNESIVNELNAFYESWWSEVMEETKYSVIDLGVDSHEVITCHDAHIQKGIPPWNQELIRKGKPMDPSSFLVNFTKSGKYKVELSRWPKESGLALGDGIMEEIPATPYTNKLSAGNAMKFKEAHLKIGNQEYTFEVDNSLKSAVIEVDVTKGETDLVAYFDLVNGTKTNTFYIYFEKLD